MKEQVEKLVNEDIKDLNVFVYDSFTSIEEGKKKLNIVLDSDTVIDLNRITEASRIINKKLDSEKFIDDDIYEVDIYSKEKGEE